MNPDLVEYHLGETVYLKVAPEQPGMVTGITYRPSVVVYMVTWAQRIEEINHYGIELTRERNFTTEKEAK